MALLQRGNVHWTVNYSGTQIFFIKRSLFVSFQTFGYFGWFKLVMTNFLTDDFNNRSKV